MGQVTLRCVDSFQLPQAEQSAYSLFLQRIMNRRWSGFLRYEQKSGGPTARQKYMSRLAGELEAYRKTGNAENLYNIANYAYLESRAPENKKFHFDNEAVSATRKKFKGDES